MPLPLGFSGFPEPQYTKTPNIIFDVLLSELSGSQLKVLLFVVRKSVGWTKNHEMHPLSIALIQAGTGLSKEPVIDALSWLVENKMVIRQKNRSEDGRQGSTSYRLRFNTDSDPGSENPTLDKESRVGKVGDKSDSGGDAYNKVLKETKENCYTSPTPSGLQTQPDNLEECDEDGIIPEKRAYKKNWKKKKEPKASPATDRLRQMREGNNDRYAGQDTGVGALIPSRTTSSIPTPAEAPVGPPVMSMPQRWNILVPESEVDVNLYPVVHPQYREMEPRWDEVCLKAKALIAGGAEFGFGKLLQFDKKAERWWWQMLLTGDLDWLMPQKNGKAQPSKPKHAADWEPWMGEDWETLDWKEKKVRRLAHAEKRTDV